MNPERFSTFTESAIGALVDRFYAKVRRDPALGPVFEEAIAEEDWPEHLATMHRFWSTVMLVSRQYSGDPVGVHRAVRGIDRSLFPRWLALFEATATEVFTDEPASQLIERAHRIAASLQLAVFHRLGTPPEGLARRHSAA